MKKILFLVALIVVIAELNAHASCIIENIQKQKACTGGAAPVQNSEINEMENISDKEHLENMYSIPSISAPTYYKNGFPILNPSQNCMFGSCQP